MADGNYRPDWQPQDAGSEFACSVMPGVGVDNKTASQPQAAAPVYRPSRMSADDYASGITAGDRVMLSRAITVIESNAARHFDLGQEIIQKILPCTGKALRVGITGVPGAGKSTFIEALGTRLCRDGHRVAVLAVDPSSNVTGGSILGDKTRMELLSRNKNAYIRPSPSGGVLGGVARKSRETMLVCEAAGFDVIFVETVGVGQSEITVRSMVDMFLLLQIAGAGDELQGMKKGVMECSDLIVVNKADGDNILRANAARAEYERILHYLHPSTEGWITKALTCSALTGEGIETLWNTISRFHETTLESGVFRRRRERQSIEWVHAMIEEQLKRDFFNHKSVRMNLPIVERMVVTGQISPTAAVLKLFKLFEDKDV